MKDWLLKLFRGERPLEGRKLLFCDENGVKLATRQTGFNFSRLRLYLFSFSLLLRDDLASFFRTVIH